MFCCVQYKNGRFLPGQMIWEIWKLSYQYIDEKVCHSFYKIQFNFVFCFFTYIAIMSCVLEMTFKITTAQLAFCAATNRSYGNVSNFLVSYIWCSCGNTQNLPAARVKSYTIMESVKHTGQCLATRHASHHQSSGFQGGILRDDNHANLLIYIWLQCMSMFLIW